MVHLCADEVGIIGAAITAISMAFKPVRDCAKCWAIYAFNKARGK